MDSESKINSNYNNIDNKDNPNNNKNIFKEIDRKSKVLSNKLIN